MNTVPSVLSPEVAVKSANDKKNEKLKKACQDFESILTGYMLKSMRSAVSNSDLIEKNIGEDIFTDMLDDEYSKIASKTGKMGLADILYKQLDPKTSSGEEINKAIDSYRATKMRSYTPVENFQTESAAPKTSAVDPELALRISKYNSIISGAARDNKVDPQLIRAIISTESNGYADAVSPKGAKGLMQLMDTTAADLGVKNAFDPKENIYGGARYIRDMLDRYGNDLEKAVASYNAGPGAVDAYNGVPPYPETSNYVQSVISNYKQFKEYYGG